MIPEGMSKAEAQTRLKEIREEAIAKYDDSRIYSGRDTKEYIKREWAKLCGTEYVVREGYLTPEERYGPKGLDAAKKASVDAERVEALAKAKAGDSGDVGVTVSDTESADKPGTGKWSDADNVPVKKGKTKRTL